MDKEEKQKAGRKPAEIINGVKMTEKLKEVLDYAWKIFLFMGCGNFVAFLIAGARIDHVYVTMHELLSLLDAQAFVRINKKYIANMKHVKRFKRKWHGYLVYFKDSTKTATVSETYKDDFHRMLVLYPKIERPKGFDLHFT